MSYFLTNSKGGCALIENATAGVIDAFRRAWLLGRVEGDAGVDVVQDSTGFDEELNCVSGIISIVVRLLQFDRRRVGGWIIGIYLLH